MVLSLNSFGLSLTDSQVQAGRLVRTRLRGSNSLARLSSCRGHGGPLAVRNVDKFAQKDLVLAADYNILLGLLELSGFLFLLFKFAQIGINVASLVWLDNFGRIVANWLANLCNLIELGLVDPLVAAA